MFEPRGLRKKGRPNPRYRFPTSQPESSTLALDGNVGDHDLLPRRIAASHVGAKRSCAFYRRHF
jgi:hypothetical protein